MASLQLTVYLLLKATFKPEFSQATFFGLSFFLGFAIVNSLFFVPGFTNLIFSMPNGAIKTILPVIVLWYLVRLKNHRRNFIFYSIGSLLLYPVNFLITTSKDDSLGLHSSLGTLHTGKYVFLAEYVKVCKEMPIVQHNLGQSNFSSLMSFMSDTSAVLNLLGSLSYAKFALSLLIYSMFRDLIGFSRKISIYATVVTVLGTFSLSFSFLLIHDSGNPLLFNGYSDVMFGIFALILSGVTFSWREAIGKWKLFLLQVPIQLTLLISSPQISIFLVSFWLLILVRRSSYQYALLSLSSMGIALLIWRNTTGMFTTRLTQEFAFLPNTNSKWLSSEILSPGIPFMVGTPGKPISEIDPKLIDLFKLALSSDDPQRIIWYLESALMVGIRVLFWPIMGLILSFYFLSTSRSKLSESSEIAVRISFKRFSLFVITSFVLLFPVSLLFKVGGMKWETTRFVFPSLVLLMLALSVFSLKLMASEKWFSLFLVTATVLPTTLYLGLILIDVLNSGLITAVSDTQGTYSLFGKSIMELKCRV